LAVHSLQLPFEKTFSMGTFRDLIVYKKAFQLAMEIFEMTKKFPGEEKYSLIDQIRKAQDRFVFV
jgi:23S rRNA-intervening sequence protein